MTDPYSPPANASTEHTKTSWHSLRYWVMAILFAIVFINYLTASKLVLELYCLFFQAVFCLSPIAIAAHLGNVIGPKGSFARRVWPLALVPLISIPLSFACSWLGYLSDNPYEQFALTNWFFGPFGWMQWFWLVLVGIVPALVYLPLVQNSRLTVTAISFIAILGHLHNAYWVWVLCHTRELGM